MSTKLEQFHAYRERMNARILDTGTLETKRFFALDTRTYEDGALSARTKELLGLVASAVLRCDDCITYHLVQSARAGVTRAEIVEALNVALVVGGSIVIPHLRRAYETLDELAAEPGTGASAAG